MLRSIFAAVLLCISLSAAAKPRLLEHIPLKWRATSDLRLGTTQMSDTPVTVARFVDQRPNKELIGENREDSVPMPVSTSDDVGAFVSSNMRQLFDQAGMKTVDDDGQVKITGEVKKFFVREEATYKSIVEVHLTVADRDGKILWNGLASGDATRFGRSYKAENYYEVLSDAVVNTVSSILQSAEIQRALAGHAAVAATPAPRDSVE